MNENTFKEVLKRTLTASRPSAIAAALTAHIPWKWGYRPNLVIRIWKSFLALVTVGPLHTVTKCDGRSCVSTALRELPSRSHVSCVDSTLRTCSHQPAVA